MSSDLWHLDQVRLGPAARPRLQPLALRIGSGITVVLGESGAGKTSLLNLLVQFERPDVGRIHFQAPAGRLRLAWVPVDGGLWPQLTVREHIAGVAAGPDGDVERWLALFDLHAIAAQRAATLSRGERSRVSVARALASSAAVLVMDEPLAHVDSAALPRYWMAVLDAVRANESSLVLATHAPEVALQAEGEAICLSGGRLIWQGTVSTLYDDPPDPRTALFLGPTNWFDPAAAEQWLGRAISRPLNVRPERLAIIAEDSGSMQVSESRFAGSIAETDLISPSGARRRFWHRPAGPLRGGQSVALQALLSCLLLMGMLCLPGCGETAGHDRTLTFARSRHYCVPSEGAMLPAPRAMTFSPAGEMYVLDRAGRVLVYDREGALRRQWRMPDNAAGNPEGVLVLRDGRVAIADTHYHQVLFFSQQGKLLGSLGEQGEQPGQFIYTESLAQDDQGCLYVAEYGGDDRVQKFTEDGKYLLTIGGPGTAPGEFQRASGVFWKGGIVFVADAINNRVQAFSDDGKFLRVLADAQTAGLHYPYDMALAPDGTIYIAEYGASRLTQLAADGTLLGHFGSPGRGLGQFTGPWGVAVRQDGLLVVADTGNKRLVELRR